METIQNLSMPSIQHSKLAFQNMIFICPWTHSLHSFSYLLTLFYFLSFSIILSLLYWIFYFPFFLSFSNYLILFFSLYSSTFLSPSPIFLSLSHCLSLSFFICLSFLFSFHSSPFLPCLILSLNSVSFSQFIFLFSFVFLSFIHFLINFSDPFIFSISSFPCLFFSHFPSLLLFYYQSHPPLSFPLSIW